MENLQNFLLIIHIIVAILIVILVLLQPSSGGDGLVSSYGGANSFVSARGAANFLSKTTMILAVVFMCNTLFLGMIAHKQSKDNSIIDSILQQEQQNNEAQVPLAQ
jgi:preprotein translocase subunit SecG